MNGYVKLHRKMTEWEWYTDVNTKAVFLHLLLMANYKDGYYKGMEIKRGQVITGRKALARVLGLSEQTVRTSLNRLKSTNEITIKSTNKLSLVTIENYDLYQSDDAEVTSKSTSKSTNNQPTTNQQLTTSKKLRKKEREEYLEREKEREPLALQHDMFAPIKAMLAAEANEEVQHE